MQKAKLKKEKKYISIVLVPHSLDKVKVLKFSKFYSKLAIFATLILTFILCLSLFIVHIIDENNKLKRDVSTLSELNIEQKNLLSEKAAEISEFKKKEDSVNNMMSDIMKKYNEITDNYVSGKTNRSASSSDRSFISDINELKELLDKLRKEKETPDSSSGDLTETESKLKKYMESIPTLWPTSGRVSSPFGVRTDPFHFGKGTHEGIDISADPDQPIKAAASGTVTFSGYNGGYGNCVIINHGRGITTIYAHSSKLLVKKGQTVNQGDVIAKVGSTGRSTGPHLHFEVRINDTPVDPMKYLSSN